MSETLQKISAVLMGAVLAVGVFALIASTQANAMGKKPTSQSIAAIALSDPVNFSTLVKALSCENLVGLVNGNRQLTVFAPTNEAFGLLGLDESNVCEADLSSYGGLSNILAYHVTPGIKPSKTVLNRTSMNMLNRQMAPIANGEIGGAELSTMLDIRATNGVVHVLNEVMLP